MQAIAHRKHNVVAVIGVENGVDGSKHRARMFKVRENNSLNRPDIYE